MIERKQMDEKHSDTTTPPSDTTGATLPNPASEWRPRSPRLYLIGSLFSVLVACFYCIPLTPVFIKWFVPFPQLEQAQVLTGRIEVIGEYSYSSKRPPAYYVVNETGRHRVYCGLPTKRQECFQYGEWMQGATGSVWFDETFGILQWDLTLQKPPTTGRKEERSYLVEKDFFENKFDFNSYNSKFFIVFLVLGVAAYQFRRYRRLKTESSNQSNGDQALER